MDNLERVGRVELAAAFRLAVRFGLHEGIDNHFSLAGNPPTLVEWTRKNYPGLIENFGLSFFHQLVDSPKIGEKILRMKWWLWDFTREHNDLLLADHPCIFTNGIDDPNLGIALPIGPRKAFMATSTDRVATLMHRQRPKDPTDALERKLDRPSPCARLRT
jgi:hypothetical protein